MKFKLMLYEWEVVFTEDNEKLIANNTACSGTIHYSTQTIYIDRNLSTVDMYKTIRHELTHATIYETQIEVDKTYTEEDLCEFMAKYGKFICSLANEIVKEFEKEE